MRKIICAFLLLLACPRAEANNVVLIHGLLLSSHHMVPIGKQLRNCGLCPYYFSYASTKDTICGHGSALVEYLQCIAQNNPGEPIDFVTHSIGTLVLRCALNSPGCPPEAKMGRAVLLAPPNQGSSLARYFRSWFPVRFILGNKSGWELIHYGPCDISACIGEFPECMCTLVIAGNQGMHPVFQGTPNDKFLTVEETRLNTPHTHRTIWCSHGNLLTCPYATHLTKCFLLGN